MKILVVEDKKDTRENLSKFLIKIGHQVTQACNGKKALDCFHAESFDVVLTDLIMPELNGLKLIEQIKKIEQTSTEIVIITGHADVDSAIQALRSGAFDFLRKPVDVRRLAIVLEKISAFHELRNGNIQLKKEIYEHRNLQVHLQSEAERFRSAYFKEVGLDNIAVYSKALRDVVALAEKYSEDRNIPILIEGETGTGKELIARYIHCFSEGPKTLPFVAINCGAISRELFEGEFFGHAKGAFTGATATGQKGKLEAADGGTLLLDEIGEMPLDLQIKLLRVLEEKRFYRLGSTSEVKIDIRLLAATNKSLHKEVSEGRFREDLFYRINVGYIRIPPLRERKESILPFAQKFIKKASVRNGKTFIGFDHDAEEFLLTYTWPGNIRELKNCMRRIQLLWPGGVIRMKDLAFMENSQSYLDEDNRANCPQSEDVLNLPKNSFDLKDFNRKIIRQALDKHEGNQTETAIYLGISRRILQGQMKKLDIS